jgi:hypothetical protein
MEHGRWNYNDYQLSNYNRVKPITIENDKRQEEQQSIEPMNFISFAA